MILGKKDRARVAELEAQVEELKNEAREEMRKTTYDLLEKRDISRLLEASNARERKLRAELADRTVARRDALTLAVLANDRLRIENSNASEVRDFVTILLDLPSPEEAK